MRGFEIIGTGHHVPGSPVTNDDLSRVMDTNDEWIFKRSGIKQRHYTPEGMGASDLALEASRRAIEAAGIRRHLGTVVSGGDVKRHKPAPDPYLLAGARLGIQRALAVEDSPAGMESARAAGFEALRIAHPARMMECVRERLTGVR